MTVNISDENANMIEPGMTVYLNNEAVGTVNTVSSYGENTLTAEISTKNLSDGKYELDIIVESISPIHFILN